MKEEYWPLQRLRKISKDSLCRSGLAHKAFIQMVLPTKGWEDG